MTAGVRVGDRLVISGKQQVPKEPRPTYKKVKGKMVLAKPKKEAAKKDPPKLLRSIIIIDIDEFKKENTSTIKQEMFFTNEDAWTLYAMDESTVLVGKKDGTLDIIDVVNRKMLGTYKLKIKSGVQDIARHTEDPSIFALTTMVGVNLVQIS